MQQLKPIYDHDSYSAQITKVIYQTLYTEIFAPIIEMLKEDNQKVNASTTILKDALRSGRIQYVDGFFTGPLNARISKELREIGAKYNKTRKAFALNRSQLPQDVMVAISEGNIKAAELQRKVDDFLRAIESKKLALPNLDPFFGDTLDGLNKQFQRTSKQLTGESIEIPLRPDLMDELKDAYTANLNLYIDKWKDEQVLKLRQKVSQNVQAGFRAQRLVEDIQAQKGVSYNKAKFLARQETSLMVSKYRQIRYEDLGIRKYQWSTSHDERVRPAHKALQGKVFRFDQPPVTDLHTMARNNPGEDYNCRCVAIPVLSNYEVLEKNYANA